MIASVSDFMVCAQKVQAARRFYHNGSHRRATECFPGIPVREPNRNRNKNPEPGTQNSERYNLHPVRSYWIRIRGDHAEGDLSCEAGHRLPSANGSADGIFAGWRWTGRDLVVEQDRYGFYPLFEWRSGETRTVSTDLLTLVERGAPTGYDLDALSVFVRVGFFVGTDTPFTSIRALHPPPLPRRALPMSRLQAVDAFIDGFRGAIARRLPSAPFVMPLSGGRDSRHILLALRDAGHVPRACVTVRHFPPRANDDEAIARELCGALRVEHRVLDQPRDRAAVERRKNEATHLCSDEHAHFVILAEHLRAHTPETYDGIAGDVLSQSTYLRPDVHALFERGDLQGVAEFVLDGYGTMMAESALARVLDPAIYCELSRERAVSRLATEAAAHVHAPNPTGSFFFNNRTRREIALAPFGLMRDITAFAPYLDHEVFDLLAGLPASLLMDRRLHTDAIARAWPQFAGVPYERKGLKTRDRAATRAVARALCRAVLHERLRRWVRPAALMPGLAASVVDGSAERLWHAPLVFYLDQMMAVAAAASVVPRAR
jgi:asparagine synthase (glutamine-hydrolysing)